MPRALTGAIVPHAPLLLPATVASDHEPAFERVRAGSRAVVSAPASTRVVMSPHAPRTGVYLSQRGDLGGFGLRHVHAGHEVDAELVHEVASRWRRPALEGPLDHGIVVASRLLSLEGPVISIGFGEEEPDVAGAAAGLADVIAGLEGDAMVIASVNSGAGITPAAPLAGLGGGPAQERELRSVLEADVAGVTELAPRLAAEGGSCGLGPLLVLGLLFAGVSMEVLAHEWPFGVGYLVARTRSAG